MTCGHCRKEVTAKDLRWKPKPKEASKGSHALAELDGKLVLVCLAGLLGRWSP